METTERKAAPEEKDFYTCISKALSLFQATIPAESWHWDKEISLFIDLPENKLEFCSLKVEALGINLHIWEYKLLQLLSFDVWPNKERPFFK